MAPPGASQAFALRRRDPPACVEALQKRPHALHWPNRFGPAPHHLHSSPSYVSTWRHEQSPQWASEIAPTVRPRTALTADEQAQVDGVVGQLRVKLAKNLNRTVDTFRQWCAFAPAPSRTLSPLPVVVPRPLVGSATLLFSHAGYVVPHTVALSRVRAPGMLTLQAASASASSVRRSPRWASLRARPPSRRRLTPWMATSAARSTVSSLPIPALLPMPGPYPTGVHTLRPARTRPSDRPPSTCCAAGTHHGAHVATSEHLCMCVHARARPRRS